MLSHKTQVKKNPMSWGSPFQKKDSFFACLSVFLEIEEKLCCLFQFHQNVTGTVYCPLVDLYWFFEISIRTEKKNSVRTEKKIQL